MLSIMATKTKHRQSCIPINFRVLWLRDVVVITTAQLHLTKPELRFCPDLNPACGVSDIRDGEDF